MEGQRAGKWLSLDLDLGLTPKIDAFHFSLLPSKGGLGQAGRKMQSRL